jgi:hypothetical protein
LPALDHDAITQNRIVISSLCLSMIFRKTGFHFSGSCSSNAALEQRSLIGGRALGAARRGIAGQPRREALRDQRIACPGNVDGDGV